MPKQIRKINPKETLKSDLSFRKRAHAPRAGLASDDFVLCLPATCVASARTTSFLAVLDLFLAPVVHARCTRWFPSRAAATLAIPFRPRSPPWSSKSRYFSRAYLEGLRPQVYRYVAIQRDLHPRLQPVELVLPCQIPVVHGVAQENVDSFSATTPLQRPPLHIRPQVFQQRGGQFIKQQDIGSLRPTLQIHEVKRISKTFRRRSTGRPGRSGGQPPRIASGHSSRVGRYVADRDGD